MVMPIEVCAFGAVLKDVEKKIRQNGNQRKNRDHPDHSIVKIGLNTGKSPGDLKRLFATNSLGKDHQLTLVSKTPNEYKNNKARID